MASRMWMIKQLLKVYPYSDRHIRRMIQTGEIRATKRGRKWLIPDEEVRRLLGQQGIVEPPLLSEFVDLLKRWRDEAFFLSLDQLMIFFGSAALDEDELRTKTNSQRVSQIYDAAKGHHLQGIPEAVIVMPLVVEEGLFQRLRQCYPDDPVWEAQESWGLAYATYFEAFGSFFAEAQRRFEDLFAAECYNKLREQGLQVDVDSVLDLVDELKKKDVDSAIKFRLAAVIASCDLLTFGITELPSNTLWCLEVDKLQRKRAEAVDYITKLPKLSPVALDHIGTAARLLWEHEPNIREKTKNLLDKLQSVRKAQDDLLSKLTALESRLYDVGESTS